MPLKEIRKYVLETPILNKNELLKLIDQKIKEEENQEYYRQQQINTRIQIEAQEAADLERRKFYAINKSKMRY